MLLENYSKRIIRAECSSTFESLHCIADLDQDIEKALPYLNSELGGYEYLKDPPAVIFKANGKLITVQGKQIAVNALKTEEEAVKVLEWLKKEINHAWENKDTITPSYEGQPRPNIVEILKCLPKTNCRQCGFPTCMVFATKVAAGIKAAGDCPEITATAGGKLNDYMGGFKFE